MKIRLARTILAATAPLLVVGLSACGSNNKNNNGVDAGSGSDIDAGPTIDAPVACTTTALGAQVIDPNSPSDGMVVLWDAPVTTDIGEGAGNTAIMTFQFYALTGAPDLTMPVDLSAGIQNNFGTCSACMRLDELDSTGAIIKSFFQSGGTLSLTADPLATNTLMGTLTNLSMIEVTIDNQNGSTSTAVPGGVCLSLGNITLAADAVPAAWTCSHAAFNDGTNCDCNCGAHDPDCDIAAAPVVGCTGTQICSADVCTDTCNVLSTPPVGCPVAGGGTCGFQTADQDICYTDPAAVDPAVLGAACASATPLLCAVTNTVAKGLCDNFFNNDSICRKACDTNAQCTTGQVCAPLFDAPGTKGVCGAPPANDKCQAAATITIGTPIDGTTAFAVSNYNAGLEATTCTGFPQPGGDVAYKVTLTAGQAITATLSNVSATFDPSLSILGPGTAAAVCDAATVTCLAGADAAAAGAGETFSFTATTAGTYFIIVDSFAVIPDGTFTLTVTSP